MSSLNDSLRVLSRSVPPQLVPGHDGQHEGVEVWGRVCCMLCGPIHGGPSTVPDIRLVVVECPSLLSVCFASGLLCLFRLAELRLILGLDFCGMILRFRAPTVVLRVILPARGLGF